MRTRIGGATRYDTSALLADEFVGVRAASAAGAPLTAAIVVSGEDAAQGIDALSATFLAGVLGAPVLLTARDALPEPTAAALRRLLSGAGGAARVHVMGGAAVVSEAVLAAVRAVLPAAAVSRVQGPDRYATAVAAATLGASSIGSYALLAGLGARRTALLASGSNPADGLSAGPVAHAARTPLLLTQRDALPGVTAAALRDLDIGQVIALGGTAAISTRVLDAVDASGVAVVTVPGATRYDTAAILLALASAPQLGAAAGSGDVGGLGLGFADADVGYLANGARFPDALTAGPVAGASLRPLYLTAPEALSPETATVIRASAGRSLVAIGLAGAVPDAVLDAAAAAADG